MQVMDMLEQWGLELLKGIGRLFLNPLLYWFCLLTFVIGYKRIRRDRRNFGKKIIDQGNELAYTLWPSILGGILISLIVIGTGVVFNHSTLFVLSIVMIGLSLSFKPTLLSPGYTIGITYLILLFAPALITDQSLFDSELFTNVNYAGLALILGLFLIIEGLLFKQTKKAHTYPDLLASSRGGWIGQHHLTKLAVIPFVTPIPMGELELLGQFWPHVPVGDGSYGLIVFPFVIGFGHKVIGTDPNKAANQLSQSTTLLGFIVLFMAVGSLYVDWLPTLAIAAGILGREYISYRHRTRDMQQKTYFPERDQGLTILDIIPGSPAARLDVVPGDMVRKVNGEKVDSIQSFYEALQGSGAFFKLELLDKRGEIRFVQSAFYEGEQHELGIVFVKKPFRQTPA